MEFHKTVFESLNWSTAALALVLCLVIYVYLQWSQRSPGPTGLPLVGYYPFLSKDECHKELHELSKRYGDVYCLSITGQQYVHIQTMKHMREISVAKADCFSRRSEVFSHLVDVFGDGILMVNGEEWKVLRKFYMSQFKELGMGKKTQETVMMDCMNKIITTLRKSAGCNFDGLEFFGDIGFDIVGHMMFGGAKLNEQDVKEFSTSYEIVIEFIKGSRILLAGPILKYFLIPFKPEYRKYRKHLDRVYSIMTTFVRQHEREFDKNNIRNLIDSFINEKRSLQAKNDPSYKYFKERGLVSSLIQFYGDGALPVGWLTAAVLDKIAQHPEVQKAIHAEVDDIIGRNRFPSWDDRSKLKYTNATIYETYRVVLTFPLSPSLECTKETTIGGCRIQKGTITLFNMHAAFQDPIVYDNPQKFDPTRFLPINGGKPRCELPIKFGVGKRSCAGEPLVNMEVLLYVTTVMQHFDLHPIPDNEKVSEGWRILFRATARST